VPSCIFFVAVGNSFWLYRSVFWLWGEIVLGVTSLPIVPTIFTDSTLSDIWQELALHYFPADCFGINFFYLRFFSGAHFRYKLMYYNLYHVSNLRVQYSCAVVSFFFVVVGKLILYEFSC
jgi:hypothetical protein